MKLYANGLIGHDNSNLILDWSGGDNFNTFVKNCETQPDDWYYRDAIIKYQINSNGHRAKEISDLNLDNYILCLGCSHTEGVGLEQEKTYPHLLAQKLNCDYYSMGLGATGIDVVLHNLIVWFGLFNKKPKAVIVQWPDFTRMLTGTSPNNLQPQGLWAAGDDYQKFVILGIDLKFFDARKILIHAMVQSIVKVPIVYFGLQKIIPFDDNTIIEKIVDYARDMGHAGIKSHEIFANSIYDYLINNECSNFYQNIKQKN
jgi:hypothetical protein